MDRINQLLDYFEECYSFESSKKIDWVKVMIFQTETSLKKSWKECEGLYYISDVNSYKSEVFQALEFAENSNVNLLVFPELSIPEALISNMQDWSTNKEIIIVAGSHYAVENGEKVNKCPIIYNGQISFSYKIFSSPNEISPIDGLGIPRFTKLEKKIKYFKNTIIGDFVILICADHLRSDLRSICLLKYDDIDFFIVPAFHKDSLSQHSAFSSSLLMYENGFYGIYSNNKCYGYADGKSSLIGISNSMQWLREMKYTDSIPNDKLIEIQEGYDSLVFEVNIYDKKSTFKKQIIENPHNIRGVKQINLLKKRFEYIEKKKTIETVKKSEWNLGGKDINKNNESFLVVDFSRSNYKWDNLKIINNSNEFYYEIPPKYVKLLSNHGFKLNKKTNSILDNKLSSIIIDSYNDIDNIDILLNEVAEETALYFIKEANRGNLKKNRIMYGVEHISRSSDEEKIVIIDVYTTDYFTFKFMTNLYNKLKSIKNIFKIERLEDINKFTPFFNSIGVGGFIILQKDNDNIFLFSQRSTEVNCSGAWHFSYDKTFMPIDVLGNVHPLKACLHRAIEKENGIDIFNSDLDIKYGISDIGFIFNDRLEFEICSFVKINLNDDIPISSIQRMYELAEDGIYQTTSMLPISLENGIPFIEENKATPESIEIFKRLKLRLNQNLI